jgi:NADP-dependent 3-hydroxy acid dehydrogenase YdfG
LRNTLFTLTVIIYLPQVAIITGASSGIGYTTALTLSKTGIRVPVGARRTEITRVRKANYQK